MTTTCRARRAARDRNEVDMIKPSTLQLAAFVLVLVNTAKVVQVNVEDMELEAKSFREFILCSCWQVTLQLLFRTSK